MSRSTSNLTRFFRNPAQFKALEHVIVPDIAARKGASGSLALWSVGCSTGEEAFSLAILLREILPSGLDARIVAIDRDRQVVGAAERAIYTEAQVAGVPQRLRDRYFERCAGGYRAADEVRSRIRFECLKVEESRELGVYDIVMCRNLLTYADEKGERLIAARLWDAMATYSYLLVGGSESLFGVDERFEYLPNDWSVSYRKRCARRAPYESTSVPLG